MKMELTPLRAAIEQLGAQMAAPDRYAYTFGDHWVVATGEELVSAIEFRPILPGPKAMPAWWSPERREVMRCAVCGIRHQHGPSGCWGFGRIHKRSHKCERITADLETGDEVEA